MNSMKQLSRHKFFTESIFSLTAVFVFSPLATQSCTGPFPAPIPMSDAFQKSETVFIGKITAITEGFPKDFKPEDAKEFRDRKDNLKRQGQDSIGRTVTFELITLWKEKSIVGSTKNILLVEPAAENSCEWNYDIAVGDEMLVFAGHYGNYLTFPAIMFDGRSGFTLIDPNKRAYSQYQIEHYYDGIKEEKAHFGNVMKELNQLHKPKPIGR